MAFYPSIEREHYKYCGTWQNTDPSLPDTMIGSWNTSYFEVVFTGTVLTLHFAKRSYFDITLDGVTEKERLADSTLTLHTAEGRHILRLLNGDRTRRVYFDGITLPDDESLAPAPRKKHYIEFVGDSISDNGESFSFHVGDRNDWDFAIKARSAMALQCERGAWRRTVSEGFSVFPHILGMEEVFFKTVCPDDFLGYEDITELYHEWCRGDFDIDFDAMTYKPDIVFIFLGTNDDLYDSCRPLGYVESFVEHYVSFVGNIRRVYGEDTEFCILQGLTNSNGGEDITRYEGIRRAVAALHKAYPGKIRFLDRDLIESWQIDISPDGTHPSSLGYAQLTDVLAPLLLQMYP